MADLAAGREPLKELSTLYPLLRVARCQHHDAFCLPRKDAPVLIVAIFHERMDLMARWVERLGVRGKHGAVRPDGTPPRVSGIFKKPVNQLS